MPPPNPGVAGPARCSDPIWRSAVDGGRDVAIAVAGSLLLERRRVPPLAIAILGVGAAFVAAAIPEFRPIRANSPPAEPRRRHRLPLLGRLDDLLPTAGGSG